MSRATAAAAALLAVTVASARAEDARPALPVYDIDALCRAQANYSFAATLGDTSFESIFATCLVGERDARDAAAGLWRVATPKARAECPDLAEGRYTHLARCLDGGTRAAR